MNLSVEQNRIVKQVSTGHSLIKGVAGSGKTTVALFKLIQMQHSHPNDHFLILTYNKTLVRYMEHLCAQHDLHVDTTHSKICTIDSIILRLYHMVHTRHDIASDSQKRFYMLQTIQKVQSKYPDLSILQQDKIAFLLEEIDWIKSCLYLSRDEYLQVDRLGRGTSNELRLRLAKNSDERNAIFDVFCTYEKALECNQLTDFKSMALYVLQDLQKGTLHPDDYDYIIVDESQDLSRAQLEIIRYMYGDPADHTILFITDVAQSIYVQSWLSKHSFKSIGFDMSGRSNILSKNYRTTRQIAEAAYALLVHDDSLTKNSDFVQPVSLERNGPKPRYHSFVSEEEEFDFLTKEIKKCSEQYALRDIVVVARNNSYLQTARNYLISHGVDAAVFQKKQEKNLFQTDSVKLFTMHSIKGLEAPIVFLIGLNQDILPARPDLLDEDRKLLYVGMTRAKECLYMSNSHTPCCYLKEIPDTLLQTDNAPDTLYDISPENYLFTERLNQLFGKEEEVRQWFLRELILHYGYPKNCIQIEAPIQCGSRKFFVDIIVYANDSQTKPHLYIETKQPGEDLDSALQQVKSYIVPGNAPHYVVVTDGMHLIVERYTDGMYESCAELPAYMDPTIGARLYTYYNLQNKQALSFQKTLHEQHELRNPNDDSIYDSVAIPVMGTIAAGNLQFANETFDHAESLPCCAIHSPESKFLLHVTGDSMIDFDIYEDDYLLVQKQQFAADGSIVIGGRRSMNEATVKQYHYDGQHTVTLHPGNRLYDDIRIEATDFYINGVVVGILRSASSEMVIRSTL